MAETTHYDQSQAVWERGSFESNGFRLAGQVTTKHGIVLVRAYPAEGGHKASTQLRFIHDGREHIRWLHRQHERAAFSQRYLVTLAKRFVAEVVARHAKPEGEGTR